MVCELSQFLNFFEGSEKQERAERLLLLVIVRFAFYFIFKYSFDCVFLRTGSSVFSEAF